jgi:acetyltransferase-like isoleucine patch superfamily enzyme
LTSVNETILDPVQLMEGSCSAPSPLREQRPIRSAVWARVRMACMRALHGRARFGRGVELRRRFCLRQSPGAEVAIGDRCILDNDMTIECRGTLRIGNRTIFGHHCTIAANELVEIGEDCLIAEMVCIRDHNHCFDRVDVPFRTQGMVCAPVRIGNNVWLGAKVTIAKGVTIGDNVVIGANAVVTKDIPSNAVAVGVPARVVRMLG